MRVEVKGGERRKEGREGQGRGEGNHEEEKKS
jgi:hypothetical protein